MSNLVISAVKSFHAVTEDKLDKILESGGQVVAPSFGIAKNIQTIAEYGDVVFGVSPDMLRNEKIHSRDIWSATYRDIPQHLIVANDRVTPIAKRVFRKYGVFTEDNISFDQWITDAVESDNPIDYMRSMALANDYNFDQHQESIARELGVLYTQDDVDNAELPDKIANELFTEIYKTPENVAMYMKRQYETKRGVGSMFKGSQVSATLIPYKDLDKHAGKLMEKYDPKAKEKWFEDQIAAREYASKVLDPDGRKHGSPFDTYPSDEMGGELAAAPSMAQFKKILSEYGENPAKFKQDDLAKIYRKLQDAYINIPSEYFEAKSFKIFNLNDFPYVITSNQSAAKKLRNAGYSNPIYAGYAEYYNSGLGSTNKPARTTTAVRTGKRKQKTDSVTIGTTK